MRKLLFGQIAIETKAAEIMRTGVKYKDACHVASAIYAECEYFISKEARLLKYKSNEIKMVTPIEFVEAFRFEKAHPFTGDAIRL